MQKKKITIMVDGVIYRLEVDEDGKFSALYLLGDSVYETISVTDLEVQDKVIAAHNALWAQRR